MKRTTSIFLVSFICITIASDIMFSASTNMSDFSVEYPLAIMGELTGHFGKFTHQESDNYLHSGVDISTLPGVHVLSAADGIVESAKWDGGYGFRIVVQHKNDFKTTYSHLMLFETNITNGVTVNQRQTIGYVGSTGKSTNYHLHFEIMKGKEYVDPEKYLAAVNGKSTSGNILNTNITNRVSK